MMTSGQIIAALGTTILALATTIGRMALHVRDLNKRLTQQAEKHGRDSQKLQAEWRGELKEMVASHQKLLLQTNRTLDAWLSPRAGDDEEDEDA